MKTLRSHLNRQVVAFGYSIAVLIILTSLITGLGALPARAERAASSPQSSMARLQLVTIPQAYTSATSLSMTASAPATQVDLRVMAMKLQAAHSLLNQVWGDAFRSAGMRYSAPRLQPYYSPMMTGCGLTPLGNAIYCAPDHAIYFDVNFFASEMARAGQNIRTDGDMAPIVILAHEWGHAVQRMAGISGERQSLELQADCLAGAFVLATRQYLESGDLQEATFSLRAAGDDAWAYRHGTGQDRVGSFERGFQGGTGQCGVR